MKTFLLALVVFAPSAFCGETFTKWVTIQPDHWLWLHRISHGDPAFKPKGFPVSNPNFSVAPFLSANDAYTKCGLLLGKYEGFVYTNRNKNMVAKLSAEKHDRMLEIHKTIEAWRNGRFDEWHHEATQQRPNKPALVNP